MPLKQNTLKLVLEVKKLLPRVSQIQRHKSLNIIIRLNIFYKLIKPTNSFMCPKWYPVQN